MGSGRSKKCLGIKPAEVIEMVGSCLLRPSAMSMDRPSGSPSARFLLLFLCVCCCFFQALSAKTLHPDEVTVLKQIDAKLKVGWDFSVDPCSRKSRWLQDNTTANGINSIVRNVTCGKCNTDDICRVVSLSLKTQNLTGVLPPEVANLTSLVQLDLTRNYINGTIPREWATLSVLNISLGGNRISGRIPDEIGDIASLESLVLENNLLEGPIPGSLGRLQNLSRLILSGNYLTGKLPESLGNLKSLIDFRIDGNDIYGKVPRFIGNWTNLVKLHMQGTSLKGPFPSEISTLRNIFELRVSDFKGDGNFPPLQNMKLKYLILRNCSISGKLPAYIGKMKTLKVLDLSFNNFTGEIPQSYRGLASSIDNLYLTSNMLTGAIPDWIRNSRKVIDVSYNNFEASSSAPRYCDQQGSLVNVFASSLSSKNKSINSCLRKDFPCSERPKNYNLFINCGGLAVNIGDDRYDEDIAPMGGSTFFLSSNKKWAFSSTGDFFGNRLGNYVAKNNTAISTSNPELYMNARLCPSSLKYYGLCLQKGNYTVKLHFAEIMFVDGNTFLSVGRRYFDVYIQDQIVMKDFNIVAKANGTGREVIRSFNVIVNGTTLEIAFRWSGKGTNSVPEKGVYGPLISAIAVTPNFTPYVESHGLTLGSIAGIVIGSLVGLFLILIILYISLRRKYHEDDGLGDINLQISQFSLRQIRSATGNFDHANKIGEGGFGLVFKGVLPNGTPVAVKQLSSRSRQGNREFITEIGMISSLQHPNLVKLLGCCIEENQLLLVYEYMENNSLSHILFGPTDKRIKLDWKTRCNICLGIARGLKYLHEESTIKIVHRDIKATNILLDKDLNVKISDFGLAKLYDAKNTHISTQIAGTRGYMAPEYAMRGHLTDKADVYSFGIVLLEIVSGKNNIIFIPDMENRYLIDWAYDLEENGKPLLLVDERLGSDYTEEEALKIIKLALLCANTSPSGRPTMSEVVSILESQEPVHIPSVTQGIGKSEQLKRTFQGVRPHGNEIHGGLNDSGQNPVFSSHQSLLSPFMSRHDEDIPR